MSNSKFPKLARRFSDRVPHTVTEMMKRVDDFVKLEKVFRTTKLPKGEFPCNGQRKGYRNDRPPFSVHGGDRSRNNYRNDNRRNRPYSLYPPKLEPRRQDFRRYDAPCPSLESLTKFPKDILATEPQLRLPPRHTTLKRQLEMALESGKLNHILKDVRRRGNQRGNPIRHLCGNNNRKGKVFNMILISRESRKRKSMIWGEED
ncbi:hypothetical protein Tco_1078820 [Tanacetum coccineum]|uniref:Reverse transcriptase domain-containing protein n=1 Tax=Tanacetum coccineum TaxID=301880 RepID=A0ABQ5HQL0_9ASTR